MRLFAALVFATSLFAQSTSELLKRGAAHEEAGRLVEASRDYDAALKSAEREGNRELVVQSLAAVGYMQYYRGDFNAALVNLQRGYDLARTLGDEKAQLTFLGNIAHVYADTKVAQYDRALEYYRQLLPQYQKHGPETGLADTLFNIASTYERKEDFATALEWYRRALAAEEKLKRTDETAYVKRSIGVTLGKLGRYDEALPLLNDALRVFAAANDQAGAMMVRQSRGVVHRRAGRNSQAIADLEATRAWYASQNNTRYLEKTEEELALAYAAAGRWHDAYDARSRHARLQRELAEKLREEHTSRLRVQFDAERKEQENRTLLRENAANARIRRLQAIILLLGGAIICVLAYLMVRMRRMAMTDELTRLPNRRHILAVAEEHVARASAREMGRAEARPTSVIAIDIDHFKDINDTQGHAAGDAVLQRVAQACRMALRPGDLIGRTGGEELLAVLPSTSERDAVAVAERVRNAVEATGVTISLGVATHEPGHSLARLLAAADQFLYRAKEAGRNRVVSASYTGRAAESPSSAPVSTTA